MKKTGVILILSLLCLSFAGTYLPHFKKGFYINKDGSELKIDSISNHTGMLRFYSGASEMTTSFDSTSLSNRIDAIAEDTINITTDGISFMYFVPRADPPTASEGMIYADTDHHLYYYNGSTWKQLDN
jgi:hypothetical protein